MSTVRSTNHGTFGNFFWKFYLEKTKSDVTTIEFKDNV